MTLKLLEISLLSDNNIQEDMKEGLGSANRAAKWFNDFMWRNRCWRKEVNPEVIQFYFIAINPDKADSYKKAAYHILPLSFKSV